MGWQPAIDKKLEAVRECCLKTAHGEDAKTRKLARN